MATIIMPSFIGKDTTPLILQMCSHCGKLLAPETVGCPDGCPHGSLGPDGERIAVITIATADPAQVHATLDGLVDPTVIERAINMMFTGP